MSKRDFCVEAEVKFMFLYLLLCRKKGDIRTKTSIFKEWIENNDHARQKIYGYA